MMSVDIPYHYEVMETKSGKVAYLDTKGTGLPVVLIHGNSGSSEIFKKQFACFGADYRMIAIDLPGHGKSDDAAIYTIPGYAAICDEVVSKLELGPFAVVGFSLGGNIALQWTQKSDQILGIMIISSAPMHYSEEALNAYVPYEGNYAGCPDPLTESQAIQYMSACGFHVEDPSLRFLIENAMRTDGKSRSQIVASVLAGDGVDETEIVNTLETPLAVVIGEDDPALNIDYIVGLSYRNLWQDKVLLLPGAQHAIVLHQTDQLHPLLLQFLHALDE